MVVWQLAITNSEYGMADAFASDDKFIWNEVLGLRMLNR